MATGKDQSVNCSGSQLPLTDLSGIYMFVDDPKPKLALFDRLFLKVYFHKIEENYCFGLTAATSFITRSVFFDLKLITLQMVAS